MDVTADQSAIANAATYQAVPPPVTGYYNHYSQTYSQFKKPDIQVQNQNKNSIQAPLVGPDYGYGYGGPPGVSMGGPGDYSYAGGCLNFGLYVSFNSWKVCPKLSFVFSIQWTTWYSNIRTTRYHTPGIRLHPKRLPKLGGLHQWNQYCRLYIQINTWWKSRFGHFCCTVGSLNIHSLSRFFYTVSVLFLRLSSNKISVILIHLRFQETSHLEDGSRFLSA